MHPDPDPDDSASPRFKFQITGVHNENCTGYWLLAPGTWHKAPVLRTLTLTCKELNKSNWRYLARPPSAKNTKENRRHSLHPIHSSQHSHFVVKTSTLLVSSILVRNARKFPLNTTNNEQAISQCICIRTNR